VTQQLYFISVILVAVKVLKKDCCVGIIKVNIKNAVCLYGYSRQIQRI